MSWPILPELSAWHAASLLSRGYGGLHPNVTEGLSPLVEKLGRANIANQVAALGNSDSTTLNQSFELYETLGTIVPYADELPARIGPIKMQWQARGPGMLAELQRWILGPDAINVGRSDQSGVINRIENLDNQNAAPTTGTNGTDGIQILPVYPWAGGFVEALPESSAVLVEAVLTDADSQLPESVRLAWGHAQLFSHKAFAKVKSLVPASIHALTTIMPALAAAEHVQLAECDPTIVSKAIKMWLDSEPTEEAVETLTTWWNEWSRELAAGSCDWPMAVSAIGA